MPVRSFLKPLAAATASFLAFSVVAHAGDRLADSTARVALATADAEVVGIVVEPAGDGSSLVARLASRLNGIRAGLELSYVRTLATGHLVFRASGDSAIPFTTANQIMQDLANEAGVASVEPDLIMHTMSTNDPYWPHLWSYRADRTGIDVAKAWTHSRGEGVVVAIIDTGITNHPDLQGQILPGYDFISDASMAGDGNGRDGNAYDEGDFSLGRPSSWHGTHVAGTVVALADNALGVAGIAPGAKVVPVRVLGKGGGYGSDIADGIIWAAGGSVPGVPDNRNPAKVLNLSLGGTGACSSVYSRAINMARALGSVVVVAAGNENRDATMVTPANCPGTITVAASNPSGGKSSFSNFGRMVNITAPGGAGGGGQGDIYSTVNAGQTRPAGPAYAAYAGTSMAAPHVAAVAALVLAVAPSLKPDEVQALLIDNVKPLPQPCRQGCGSGLLDAGTSVEAAAQRAVRPS
ncbi:S8 family serine peptidase [Pinirhizobacter sp.]|jgi:serine protease|uniref:S8 family serine peptidase n=1 Tax=Pinirhizobacter sp. TaxID=2950432 RepID=UPI002F3FDB0C